MKKHLVAMASLFTSFSHLSVAVSAENSESLNVAVLGLGGRAQGLLLECLKLKDQVHKEIRVVAVCDNHGKDSLNFLVNRLCAEQSPLADDYKKMMADASFYPDNEQGLNQLFESHPTLDRVFITSSNDRHFAQINSVLAKSSCKNLFIEKPLFKSLAEFHHFNADTSQTTIHVGLTLRYAMMTKIAEQKLKEFKVSLGRLQKVTSWEHVNFAHAWSIIMMNWRRYHSLSGGLLLEKSVHDLDLALFFMQAVDAVPKSLSITTETSHAFFKKSRKHEILSRLIQDEALRKRTESWDCIPWQRMIDFSHDDTGAIDWGCTVDAFFEEFPDDDDFTHSDIIPDRHKLMAAIQTTNGDAIDFELSVKLNDFSMITERGTDFAFEHGDVAIDIENGKMVVKLDNGVVHEFDLNVSAQAHAGGDVYVAHTILGTLHQDQLKATFSDPVVQLSTVMGLVSEEQALHNSRNAIQLTEVDGRWVVDGAVSEPLF